MTDEMALLIAACAPVPSRAAIAQASERNIAPAEFLTLVRRHRVAGLAQRGFSATGVTPPAAIAAELAAEAGGVAQRGLAMAAETMRLCRAMTDAEIPVLVLKGAPLAILAYGTLTTKQAWDIDLLIPSDRLSAAAAALVKAGYGCVLPDLDSVELTAWHRFAKDSTWLHRDNGISVELHTDLTEAPHFLLPGLTARSPAQRVDLSPGMAVPTLMPEPLFAYLCVHGALSGWRRLKWLADLAGLLRSANEAEVIRLYAAALPLGTGRAVALALAVSARIFGTPLPAVVAGTVRGDWKLRRMLTASLRMLEDAGGFDDPAETTTGTIPIHVITSALVPGWAYKRAEFRRRLRADPRGLAWLPFTLVRLVRKAGGRPAA